MEPKLVAGKKEDETSLISVDTASRCHRITCGWAIYKSRRRLNVSKRAEFLRFLTRAVLCGLVS